MTAPRPRPPRPLAVAALLVLLQGAVAVVFALLELANLSGNRVTMGLTTTVFFLGYGAALVACAWGLSRRHAWARSPVVLAQLIQLGVAWSFRGGSTTPVAVVLAVTAAVALVGVLHPSSMAALEDPAAD